MFFWGCQTWTIFLSKRFYFVKATLLIAIFIQLLKEKSFLNNNDWLWHQHRWSKKELPRPHSVFSANPRTHPLIKSPSWKPFNFLHLSFTYILLTLFISLCIYSLSVFLSVFNLFFSLCLYLHLYFSVSFFTYCLYFPMSLLSVCIFLCLYSLFIFLSVFNLFFSLWLYFISLCLSLLTVLIYLCLDFLSLFLAIFFIMYIFSNVSIFKQYSSVVSGS